MCSHFGIPVLLIERAMSDVIGRQYLKKNKFFAIILIEYGFSKEIWQIRGNSKYLEACIQIHKLCLETSIVNFATRSAG